jgi:hypothetical protein
MPDKGAGVERVTEVSNPRWQAGRRERAAGALGVLSRAEA